MSRHSKAAVKNESGGRCVVVASDFVFFLSDFLTLWLLCFFCIEAWLVSNVCLTRAGNSCCFFSFQVPDNLICDFQGSLM